MEALKNSKVNNGVVNRERSNVDAIQKYTRKMIVALKTTDQRESLDYWLTQYDR